jgi:hypothetical protein
MRFDPRAGFAVTPQGAALADRQSRIGGVLEQDTAPPRSTCSSLFEE